MIKQKMNKEELKFNVGAVVTEPGSTIKNKTGSWRSIKPVINKDKCIKCGRCWQFCPDSAITMSKEGPAEINYDYCKGCGICAMACPSRCIHMEKEKR